MSNERAVWSVPQLPPDDIYTEYDDIAAEVSKYEAHFKGKVVLCNCDDPVESNFFRYFAVNFNRLQLAKLIVVAKENSSIACRDFAFYAPHSRYYRSAYCLEINKLYDLAGEDPVKDILEQLPNRINPYIPLSDDGDFRTYKNIDIMRRADILATHPPCSLFREYLDLMFNFRKKFLLLGASSFILYRDIFSPDSSALRPFRCPLGRSSGAASRPRSSARPPSRRSLPSSTTSP